MLQKFSRSKAVQVTTMVASIVQGAVIQTLRWKGMQIYVIEDNAGLVRHAMGRAIGLKGGGADAVVDMNTFLELRPEFDDAVSVFSDGAFEGRYGSYPEQITETQVRVMSH